MASAFTRTLRSIDADRMQAPIGIVVVAGVLGAAWVLWATRSRAPVYIISREARVESTRAVAPVQVAEPGRVVATHLQLGMHVKTGDVLIELDPSAEIERIAEQATRIETIEARVVVLREQTGIREDVAKWEQRVTESSSLVAAVRAQAAAAAVHRQEQVESISDQLAKAQLQSVAQNLETRNQTLAERDRSASAEAEARHSAVASRLEAQKSALAVSETRRQLVELEGELHLAQSSLRTLQGQLARRTVRSAADGILGNVSSLQVGAVVSPGQPLATVVPTTDLHVVGSYAAGESVGRVRPGQVVAFRFEGFVWTQFGIGQGRVARVASEPSNGVVRVEMDIDGKSVPAIPLQHGLAVSAEIELESITPWTYLLRTIAGGKKGPPGGTPEAAAPADTARTSSGQRTEL